MAADTNLEASETPAEYSVLNDLLRDSDIQQTYKEAIIDESQNAQDNPPYDLFVPGDTTNDITEEVELGRTVLMPQGSGATLPQTTVLDVPFGLMRVMMTNRDPNDDSGITDDLALGLEVLDIFEMQG